MASNREKQQNPHDWTEQRITFLLNSDENSCWLFHCWSEEHIVSALELSLRLWPRDDPGL